MTDEVLNLTIDARGARTGAEQFVDATQAVVQGAGAADAAIDGLNRTAAEEAEAMRRMTQATDPAAVTMVRMGGSATSAERALERVRAAADPLYRAQQRLTQQTEILDQSFRRGLITEEEKARVLTQLQARFEQLAARQDTVSAAEREHAAAVGMVEAALAKRQQVEDRHIASLWREADAARAVIAAERQRQQAMDAQQRFNATLGVRDIGTGAAAASAAVFREQAEAQERLAAAVGMVEAALAKRQQVDDRNIATLWREAEATQALIAAERERQQAIDAQQRINAQLGVRSIDSGAAAASARVFEEQAEAQERLAAAAQQYRDQLNPLLPVQRAYRVELDRINAVSAAGLLTEQERMTALARARTAYDMQTTAVRAAAGAQAAYAGAGGIAASSSRRFGAAVQQVGYQVGDFAVQVASGQSAVTAFVQQGAQLLGIFGPAGAIAGAAFAIAGAAVNFLLLRDNTEAAKEATVDYEAAIKSAQEFTRTAAEQASFLAEERRKEKIATLEAALAEEQLTISRAASARDRVSRAVDRLKEQQASGAIDTTEGVAVLGKTLTEIDRIATTATERVAELRKQMGEVNAVSTTAASSVGRTGSAIKGQSDATGELIDGVTAYIGSLKEQTRLLGMEADEREKVEAVQRAQAIAMRENNGLTLDQIKLIREQVGAQQYLRRAGRDGDREAERAREQAAREAERSTDRVVDYAGDAFADFFADTPKSWGEMWDDMVATGRQALAKLGADLLLRPVISPIMQSVHGVQPAGPGGVSGTSAGGGPGIGDIGNLLSQGNSLFGGLGGGITSGINSLGTSLGFGSGVQMAAPSASFVGPMPLASGSLFGTTTLSGFMGGVGAGFGLGNMLGGVLGATPTNSMIGSGGGALAGAVIGSIVPGIGTLIGGLAGGLLGGGLSALFGKGGKDKLKILSAADRSGNALLGDTFDDGLALRSPFGFVGLSDNRTSGHDAAFVSKLVQTLQRSDQGVAQYLSGAEVSSVSAALQSQGGYSRSDREFGEVEFGKVIRGRLTPILEALDVSQELIAATLAGTDAEQLQQAAQELLARRQAVRDIIDYSGEEGEIRKAERTAFAQLRSAIDELALANEEFGFSAEKAAAAQRRLVEEYLGLGEAVEPMSAAEKALAAMNERIAQTAELAREVGITLSPAEIEAKLRDQLRTGFDQGIADQIRAITDPLGFALDQWEEAAAARLEEAKFLGGDLVQVERLAAIERQKIVEQYAGAATDAIRGFLIDQYSGGGSVLAPRTVLANAESEFGRLLGLARGGDAGALGDITGAAQNYLNAQRAVSASSPEFFATFDRVSDSLKAFVGDTTGMQSQSASMARVASNTEQLGPILTKLGQETARGNATMAADLAALLREVKGLRETVARQQAALDRLAAQKRAA